MFDVLQILAGGRHYEVYSGAGFGNVKEFFALVLDL
jgi:hypothetical protein